MGKISVVRMGGAGVKAVNGSYTGTGTGSKTEDVVTLNFTTAPKFLVIAGSTSGDPTASGMLIDGQTVYFNTGSQNTLAVTLSGTTVRFHGTFDGSARYSYNTANAVYNYLALV